MDWSRDRLFFHDRICHPDALTGFALVILSCRTLIRFMRLDQFGRGVRLEILDHALRNQKNSKDDAYRHQQIIGHADQIDPKIADGFGRVPHDGPHQGGGDGDARRGRGEVMDDKRDHLRQIGHGGFARVGLPIGIGGKTDGGVESQIGREIVKTLRVQRKVFLHPKHDIGEQTTHQAEKQHGKGVLPPIMLMPGVHAHDPVGQALARAKDGVKPGFAIGIQDLAEIEAHRFGDRRQHGDETSQLQPINSTHNKP